MISRLLSRAKQPEPIILAHVVGGPFLPGDQIDVELIWPTQQASGFSDSHFSQVSLDLVCRETFWYTVKSTGAAFVGNYPGHGEENHTGLPYTAAGRPGRFKISKILACLSGHVTLVNKDLDQTALVGIARFQLPANAPPSVRGNTACIEWELGARLGSTASQNSTPAGRVTVLSGTKNSDQAPQYDSSEGHRAVFEQCTVALSLPEVSVRTGQTLHGVLKAKAQC